MNLKTAFEDAGHRCNSCGCVAHISNAMAKFCPQCGVRYAHSSIAKENSNADPDELLEIVCKQLILGATEVSAYADTPLTIRLDGRLRRVADSVTANQIDDLFESISEPQQRTELANTGLTEFKHQFDDMLFANVSVFKKNGQKVITLQRDLNTTPPHATA